MEPNSPLSDALTLENIQGKIIDGFEILEKFASGGFSSVHFARHILTGNFCAVKIIDLGAQSEQTFVDIMREISVFMQVRHPNICSLYRLSVVHKILFFFMEYAENGTLGRYVKRRGGLDEAEVNRLFLQLYSALSHVHVFHFLAHRDLKLDNVLLDRNNNVKLIDFGLSGTFYCHIMKSFVGTPGYTPPEVLAGKEYGEECDVWSLGVCLYVMFTGCLPFSVKSDFHTLIEEQMNLELPGVTGIPPVPASLIKDMLEPRPDHRITLAQVRSHPWMRGIGPLPTNLVPKPIVFYRVHGYADILKFRRIPLQNPDAEIVSECAECNSTDKESVLSALKSGTINEVTTTYFILCHPLKQRPVVSISPREKLPRLVQKRRTRTQVTHSSDYLSSVPKKQCAQTPTAAKVVNRRHRPSLPLSHV